MSVKNSSYGVLSQRLHCFNCGGNSISLGYFVDITLEYSLDQIDREQETMSEIQKYNNYNKELI